MMKRTGMYLRKSQLDRELEEAGQEETLSRHKKILTEIATRQGLEITKIYEEVVSGESVQDRPQMQKLLEDVSMKKYEAVLVMEVQRLARGNTMDQGLVEEAFQFSKTKIVTPQKTYDPLNEHDAQYFAFGLFMSRQEYQTIRRQMSVGKMQSVREGNYLGSLPPFGYDVLKRAKRDRTLVFNDDSKYVTQIYDWFIDDRLTLSEIARKLTSMGVKTRQNKPEWNRGTIKDILTNQLYYGKIRWNKKKTVVEFDPVTKKKVKKTVTMSDENVLLFDGKHPAIITEERFNEAQALFSKTPSTLSRKLVNPFAGVLFCKSCGKAMVFQRYASRPNTRTKYCHPMSYSCKIKTLAYDEFLVLIKTELKAKISDFTIKVSNYSYNAKQAEYVATKNAIEENLKKDKKKLNKLFDMFEEEIYTKEEFKKRKEILNNKIKCLEDELNSLVIPTTIEYEEIITSFSKVLDTLNDESIAVIQKNMLIKSIIKRIDYSYNNGIELGIVFNL